MAERTHPRARLRGRAAAVVALLALAAIVLAHATLLPGGRWQGDEYGGLAAYRAEGLHFLRYRLLHWSPRPVSESLIYLYARLVLDARQPLITPALGFAWTVLVLAAIAGLCRRGPGLVWTGLIVAAVLAAFLLGHPVGEMFYWPMGALAYLPALAGVTCATFLIVRGMAGRPAARRLGCLAALLLASFSAEVGAMVTLCVCGLIGLTELPGWWRRHSFRFRTLARAAWWAIPLLASAAILALLLSGRAGASNEMQQIAIAHHLLPSLRASLDWFGRLLVAPDAATAEGSVAWWLPVFFLGMAGAWRQSGAAVAPARHLLALAAGLLIAAYGSLVSAAYQFGVPCCERHDSFRACVVVLALVVLAALAARMGGETLWRRVPAAAGPVLLLLGLLPPLLHRLPALRDDYRQQHTVIAVRRDDWAAGAAEGRTMLFRQPPAPHVVNDGFLPAQGHFDRATGEVPWFIAGVLDFFGKSAIDIEGR